MLALLLANLLMCEAMLPLLLLEKMLWTWHRCILTSSWDLRGY